MESTLTVQRLMHALDKKFGDLIDLTDLSKENDDKKRAKFLTRAQAAYALTLLTEVDPAHAAAAVTDGYQDCGIDAIYFASSEKTVYLVQSK